MTKGRGAMTIRIPVELLQRAHHVKRNAESFNDLVVDAVEREVRRRQGMQAIATIQEIRDRVATNMGVQPDSLPLIRALRESASDG
jgi:hypothetical protein